MFTLVRSLSVGFNLLTIRPASLVCRFLMAFLFCSGLTAFSDNAAAQVMNPDVAPPIQQIVDSNGVNLTTGQYQVVEWGAVSIGQPGHGGLRDAVGGSSSDSQWGGAILYQSDGVDPGIYTVTINGQPTPFTYDGTNYAVADGSGSTLVFDGTNYNFTGHDGSTAVFPYMTPICSSPSHCMIALISTLSRPNGEVLTYVYNTSIPSTSQPLSSITNNLGYQLKINYECISGSGPSCTMGPYQIIAINNAVEYCDPSANSCSLTQTWPTLTLGYTSLGGLSSVTDPMGRTTTLSSTTTTCGGSTCVNNIMQFPSGRQSTVILRIGDPPGHFTVTDGVGIWTYAIDADVPVTDQTTGQVTDPNLNVRVVVSSSVTGQVMTDTIDPGGTGHLALTTTFGYDSSTNQLNSIAYPGGNSVNYTYDSRGNVTQTQHVATTGSGTPNITTTASFSSTCPSGYEKVCNQPNSTTDANSNETDYTYDPAHGGVLTVTAPSVTGGRPQTRFSYSALYAWYKNSSGSIVAAASPVYEPTQASQCLSYSGTGSTWGAVNWGSFSWASASCTGTAREQLVSTAYTSGGSGTATNLQPASITTAAGDSSVSSAVSMTYDIYGNTATTTGPISGSTSAAFYDLDQRVIGTVAPDPDGGGPLLNPATSIVYEPDGQVEFSIQGTSTGITYADWSSSFNPLVIMGHGYDSNTGLVTDDGLIRGSTTQSVKLYSYDSARRLLCTRVMNNLSGGGSDACTPGTPGTYAPDQILKYNYDAANRVTSVVSGYGSGSPVTERTMTYTQNNKIDVLTDANGNDTGYHYDGQDRLGAVGFQDGTTEYYEYDGNGNLASEKLRNDDSVAYHYDALNRLTSVVMPSGTPSNYYDYDLLGDRIYSRSVSSTGSGVDYTHDALQRKVSETSYGRTVGSQYDAAGNRTRLTYPDSNYIQYSYDILNRMQDVKQNGSTTLAGYSYDDYGQVTGITRSNGVITTATYSSSSPDWSLATTGSSQNVSWSMAYTPAGQVYQRGVSNTAYAYSAPAASASYSANNVNQYSSVGGTSYSYDGNGNLTSDGSRSFAYDDYNRLTGVSGSASLTVAYDPNGRLRQTVASSTTEQYLYDDESLVVEYDGSGNILRRYVPGQGTDETLVWYEGSGLSSPHWLHTDQQGTVVATTDGSGTATTYGYSPTGEPTSWSSSAPIVRYTGQVALAAASLYDFKARMYDPKLGRFLQTDPVGYNAGMNLYAYASNDPVNNSDPSGLDCIVGSPAFNQADCESDTITGSRDVQSQVNSACNGNCDQGNQKIVTGTTSSATAGSSNQTPTIGTNGGHDYRTNNQVCRRAMTPAEQRDLISRFGLPNQFTAGSPSGNGTYMVTNNWAIPGGWVNSTVSANGLQVENVTTSVHAFVGTVDRNISSQSIATHGYGNAGNGWFGTFRDEENGKYGPTIFNQLDAEAGQYAAAHYPGC